MLLTNFHSIRPPFETNQEETLRWLVDAHAEAEFYNGCPNISIFKEQFAEKLWKVGCKPDRIEKRGHVLDDYLHKNWGEMKVYNLSENPEGKSVSHRSKIYAEHVDQVFEQYYLANSSPPDDLIHVSCTGYLSPSGAQKIVSKRGWGESTTVTHAYHMGCYGSIPAIRIGTGFLTSDTDKNRVDIVHTEICSLHTNPSKHESDQLVSQSLFADGFMKYSAVRQTDQPHFKILALREEIIPNSLDAMSWDVAHWGFKMTLAKEVAVLITRHLPGYLERLCKKAGYPMDRVLQKALFAVHPGGPKILVHVQKLLDLSDKQIEMSFEVLRNYGNMSSATLPHVWSKMLSDSAHDSIVVSLAFGPGLSISGSIMELVCGC